MKKRLAVCALDNHLGAFDVEKLFEVGKGVVEARNALTGRVRKLKPKPDLVAWIDGDCWFDAASIETLAHDLDGRDERTVIAVPACEKAENYPVLAWKSVENTSRVSFDELARGALIPIARVGAHLMTHKPSLLGHLPEAPWTIRGMHLLDEPLGDPVDHILRLYTELETAEDLSFCTRVIEGGGEILLEPRALALHVVGDWAFRPHARAYRFRGHVPCQTCETVGDRFLRADHDIGYGSQIDRLKWFAVNAVPRIIDCIIADTERLPAALRRLREGGAAPVADRIEAFLGNDAANIPI